MTDRELLTLAAKAAGKTIHHWSTILPGPMMADPVTDECSHYWNPLEEDGDALRLLALLNLSLDYRPGFVGVHKGFGPYIGQCPHNEDDPHSAMVPRRAIVRAAAAIGKAMQ